ncbi:MAG TPA: TIGR02266 family protein [Polyangiaceae bacterium]|nr:TIGR02266 family protein [Polyangiaceae bacterium]
MAEGNRKDPRARVLNMTVRYKSATVDEFIENHSHDISRGGIFIKTRAPFPAGTLLKFEVRIAEDQRLMQGVGRVVWRREPERAEEGYPAGMGIKFIKTGEGAAELISQIVAARQGEESSFDAGARENGAVSDPPRSEGRHSVPAAPEATDVASAETPSLKVEGAPAEGEIYVSSPPKKRVPVTSETRKVVLQGGDAPSSDKDKTPSSSPVREASAQAGSERAPSRPAPAARGSIVDETTAPRARSAEGQSRRATQQQSSPSVLGLVAILGAVGITLLVVKLLRGPESPPPPPPEPPVVTSAEPAPPPPAEPAPSAAEPAREAASTPPAAQAEPAPGEPTAAGGAPATGASRPAAAPSAAPTAGAPKPAEAPAAAEPPAKHLAPAAPAPAAPKPAPAAPKLPAPAASPPPAASPAPAAPAPHAEKPAPAPAPAPRQEATGAAGATGDEARPAQPAKKAPPAAAAPGEENAPKPVEPSPAKPAAPSDDNPY